MSNYEKFFTIKDVQFYTDNDDYINQLDEVNKLFIGKEFTVIKDTDTEITEDEILTEVFNDSSLPEWIDGTESIEVDFNSVYMEVIN
jgi:hypothetical protein